MPSGMQQHKNILACYEFNKPIDGFYNRLELTDPQLPDDPADPLKNQAMAYFKEWKRTYRRPNSSPVAVADDYQALDA